MHAISKVVDELLHVHCKLSLQQFFVVLLSGVFQFQCVRCLVIMSEQDPRISASKINQEIPHCQEMELESHAVLRTQTYIANDVKTVDSFDLWQCKRVTWSMECRSGTGSTRALPTQLRGVRSTEAPQLFLMTSLASYGARSEYNVSPDTESWQPS